MGTYRKITRVGNPKRKKSKGKKRKGKETPWNIEGALGPKLASRT